MCVVRIWITSGFFQFHGRAESKPQFLKSVPSLNYVAWERFTNRRFTSAPNWRLCYMWAASARVSSCLLIHLLALVSLSQLWPCACQQSQPLTLSLPRRCGSDPTDPWRDEAQIWVIWRERTESAKTVDLRVNLNNGHFLITYVWYKWSARGYFLNEGHVNKVASSVTAETGTWRPHNDSEDVLSFSYKPFCCTAFTVLQTMVQKLTEAECLVKLRNQYCSNLLKPGCILDDFLSLDLLRRHGLEDTQSKRDLFRRNVLPDESGGQLLADWVTVSIHAQQKSLWDNRSNRQQVVKMHEAEVHVFSEPVLLWDTLRWLRQKWRSRKDGKCLSSATRTPQRKLIETTSIHIPQFLGARTNEMMLTIVEWIRKRI